MTTLLTAQALAEAIRKHSSDAIEAQDATRLWLRPAALPDVCRYLRDTPGLEFNFLNSITAVDYVARFEVVYHITSLVHNRMAVLRVNAPGRDEPTVPSVVSIWRGADLQEREVWDLMGVRFEGHPNMKRLMLWEGFPGHPLRKDFVGS